MYFCDPVSVFCISNSLISAVNLPTILVLGVVVAALIGAVISIVKAKKKGKSGCGCNCSNCPYECNGCNNESDKRNK